jgi:hypothetical protein
MKARKKEDGPKQVCISRAPRGKKKSVTVVTGLSTFGKCFIRILCAVSLPCAFSTVGGLKKKVKICFSTFINLHKVS